MEALNTDIESDTIGGVSLFSSPTLALPIKSVEVPDNERMINDKNGLEKYDDELPSPVSLRQEINDIIQDLDWTFKR
jgi:hypothetical protein